MGFSAVSERLSRYPQLLYLNIFLFQGCLKAVKVAVLKTSMSQMIFFLSDSESEGSSEDGK